MIKLVELKKNEKYGYGNFVFYKSEEIAVGINGNHGSSKVCWVARNAYPPKGESGYVLGEPTIEDLVRKINEPTKDNGVSSALAKKILAIRDMK